MSRAFSFPGAALSVDAFLSVDFGEGQHGLGMGEHPTGSRVVVGRALQISIWILQLLSKKEQWEEKGGEEQGIVRVRGAERG